MSPFKSVLGVQGCVGSVFPTQHRFHARVSQAGSLLCRVCRVCARVRACACVLPIEAPEAAEKCYASPDKANTPYTVNTNTSNVLIYKGFSCVGFVLGMGNFVQGVNTGEVSL